MTSSAVAKRMIEMSEPERERLVVPMQIRQLDRSVGQLTPGAIDSALNSREQGYPKKWVDICDRMQTDPVLSFAFETRKRAVAGRPIDVDEPEDVPVELRGFAQEAASLAREWLLSIDDLEAFLMRLMDAWMPGLHVSELDWTRRHGVWLPTPLPVYTRECEWDSDSTVKCRGADYRWIRTADHPGKFLVFVPQTSSRSPACQGIGDRAVWSWFMSGMGLKFWMIAAERFGSPLAIARLGDASAPETRTAISNQLQSLMVTSTAVLTGNDSIEIMDTKATGSGQVWSELTTLFTSQKCFAMGVTPDLLMAGVNGSDRAVGARNGVRLESSKLDSKMLMGALSGVLRWVIWWNLRRDDSRGLPVLRTVFEDAPVVTAQSLATGYVRVNQQLASDGLPALTDEDGGSRFIPPPAPTGAAFSAAPQSTTAAASDVPATPTAPGSAPAASPFPDSAPSTGMPSLSVTTQSLPMSSRSRTSRSVFARAQR